MARRGDGALHAARGRLDPAEVGGRAGRRCGHATRPGRSDRRGREPDRDAGLTVRTRCPPGPAMRHGVLLQYSAHHNLAESNTVVRTTYDAFDLHGEDEYGNELRSNVAENCGEGGFGSATRLQPRERRTGHLAPPQPGDRLQVGIHVYRKSNTQLIEDNEFCRNASHRIRAGRRRAGEDHRPKHGAGQRIRRHPADHRPERGGDRQPGAQQHVAAGRRTRVGSHGSSIRPGTALLPHSSTFPGMPGSHACGELHSWA